MIDTKDSTKRIAETRKKFLDDWLRALDNFNAAQEALVEGVDPVTRSALSALEVEAARKASLTQLIRTWHDALDVAYRASYAEGRKVWGPGVAAQRESLGAAARARLRKEKGFATRFAIQQSQPKKPGRKMPAGTRSALYANALENAYNRGAVDAAPPGQLIDWVLGDARHCYACPGLAAGSPYTQETLPTVPRAGSTPCGARCKCHLRFRPVATPKKAPEKEADDREKARPIEERISGPKPTPPPGKRLPTDEEYKAIRDLEARMAFANRRAAAAHDAGDKLERDRWLKTRSEINGELIDLKTGKGIWSPPTFSDSEVLRGVDLREEDVSFLTHLRGIDGSTVHRAQAAAVAKAVEDAKISFAQLLGEVPSTLPAVPDFDDLVKRFGGSDSAFTGSFDWQEIPDLPNLHEGHLHEAQGDPQDGEQRIVLNLVGLGTAETLRAVPAALQLLKKRELDVAFGPVGEGWLEAAAKFGVWIEGAEGDAWGLARQLSSRLELAVAEWRP